jgi:hypothetical protein
MVWKWVYVAHASWVKVVNFVVGEKDKGDMQCKFIKKVVKRMNFYIIQEKTTIRKARGTYLSPQL